jgi:septum formation protein
MPRFYRPSSSSGTFHLYVDCFGADRYNESPMQDFGAKSEAVKLDSRPLIQNSQRPITQVPIYPNKSLKHMLILASASPRRKDLLEQIGLTFSVETADIDETPRLAEDPVAYVKRLAEHKAAVVFARHPVRSRLVVLGADTTVVCAGQILGKPTGEEDAVRMLRLLSGRTHQVITGVALISATAAPLVAAEITEVEFSPLTETQIAAYVSTGEPMGKAGAYAIQGRAAKFIPRIAGDYSNVVGLPLARVNAMLAELQR